MPGFFCKNLFLCDRARQGAVQCMPVNFVADIKRERLLQQRAVFINAERPATLRILLLRRFCKIPFHVVIQGGNVLRKHFINQRFGININKAQKIWKEGLNELGASKADFTVIATQEYEDVVKELVQGIQAGVGSVSTYGNDNEHKISFSLKINILSEDEYQTALSNGEYDIALYKFKATNQNSLNFLNTIINGNYMGTVASAISALKKAQSTSADKLAQSTKKCEKAILSDYSIKPVLYESSYYAEAQGVKNVQFHPGSGRVSFVNATREE